jgi:hypothetical protein
MSLLQSTVYQLIMMSSLYWVSMAMMIVLWRNFGGGECMAAEPSLRGMMTLTCRLRIIALALSYVVLRAL